MDVYMYQADLYCADCGAAIKCRLDKEGKTPETNDEADWDSGDYPKGPYPDGGGEADCPNHCGRCHCFLENPLTSDGYIYVQEQIENGIRKSPILETWLGFYDFRVSSPDAG